ncbi:MAG: TetR/AcrR family transcriptional regulator C-terminal domain-containing protein [Bifidobacterium sp.]|jgi:AcrR family transcriptional regulator|nr:TetR/AcrR family transcriptional regulator C-terminal domain-containing protein [Bifidobacterium sp.]
MSTKVGANMDANKTQTRAGLSRDTILQSALLVLDERGYDALTLRMLGKYMHFSYTAIYRHLPDKAALLDGVTEVLWLKALDLDALDVLSNDSWQIILEKLANRLRNTLLEHPNAVPLVATHPISTKKELLAVSRILEVLVSRGYEVTDNSIHLIMNLSVFVIGHVIAESVPPAGGAGGDAKPEILEEAAHTEVFMGRFLNPLLKSDQYNLGEQFNQGVHALIYGQPVL